MKRYRLTVTDPDGTVSHVYVCASTREAAVEIARRRGYEVIG